MHTNLAASGSDERCDFLDSIPKSADLDACQIFICSYLVSPRGLSLPGSWPNIVLFDPPAASTEEQIVGRVRNLGLRRSIRLIRLFVRATFHDWEHATLIQNAFPGVVNELKIDDKGHVVGLGDYVIHQGELVLASEVVRARSGGFVVRQGRLVPDNVRALEPSVLRPHELLQEIHRRLFSETIYVDVPKSGRNMGFKRRRLG
jgi:hypothetical protein